MGLLPLTLWRLAEALSGLHPGEHGTANADESRMSQRLKALGLAVVYCAVAFTALRFALGSRKPSSRLPQAGRSLHRGCAVMSPRGWCYAVRAYW